MLENNNIVQEKGSRCGTERGFVLTAVHGMLSSAPVLRMTKAGEGHEMLCVIQQVSEQQNCSVDTELLQRHHFLSTLNGAVEWLFGFQNNLREMVLQEKKHSIM